MTQAVLTGLALLALRIGVGVELVVHGWPKIKSPANFAGMLGLYTFAYASLHFLNFVGLDYGFDFALIWQDIAGKRFVVAGFAAFLILLTLAITSSSGWKKRLGENWKRVQRLIYAAALLGALHFVWQAKADLGVPLIYTGIIVLLLVVRIPKIAKVIRIPGKWMKRQQIDQSLVDEI